MHAATCWHQRVHLAAGGLSEGGGDVPAPLHLEQVAHRDARHGLRGLKHQMVPRKHSQALRLVAVRVLGRHWQLQKSLSWYAAL